MRRFLPASVFAFGLFVSAGPMESAFAGARAQLGVSVADIHFSGTALVDAVEYVRDVSGANITVNWKALEEAGVSKDSPVNIRLRGVTVRKALDLILAEASGGDKLSFDVDQNVIEITTRELVDSKMYTRVYPIQDLIMDVPDFTDAPLFDLNSTSNNQNQNPSSGGAAGGGGIGGNGGGGNTGPFGSGTTPNKEPVVSRADRAKEIVELIESVIQPDIWVDNGGKAAIRYWNGNLIVTAPRSVQEAIGGSWD